MRMPAVDTKLLLIGAAVIGGGLLLWKLTDVGKGLLSGDNYFTNTATNAAGERVTAYKDFGGPLGTIGAATNAASGGFFASAGQWLGDAAYDLVHWGNNPFDNKPTPLPAKADPAWHTDLSGEGGSFD